MERTVSATHAARQLSNLLDRVRDRGESFVIERGGEPVGRLSPAAPARCTLAELVRFLQDRPKPDPRYWETLATITKRQPKLPKSQWRR